MREMQEKSAHPQCSPFRQVGTPQLATSRPLTGTPQQPTSRPLVGTPQLPASRHLQLATPELPAMPAVAPAPAPVPRAPRASPGRHRSDSERMVFGPQKGLTRKLTIGTSSGTPSADASTAAPSTTASTAQSLATSTGVSNVASPRQHSEPQSSGSRRQCDFDQGKLRHVLNCLLPVDGGAWSMPMQPDDGHDFRAHPAMSPTLVRRASPECTDDDAVRRLPPLPVTPTRSPRRASSSPAAAPDLSTPGMWSAGTESSQYRSSPESSVPVVGTLPHQVPASSPEQGKSKSRTLVLEKCRCHLLEQYRSVYDAFSRLDGTAPRERPLVLHDFQAALARLGIEEAWSAQVFALLDSSGAGRVSLVDLRRVLVEDSPEALLWELRCRLFSVGIQPRSGKQAIRQAVDLVQQNGDRITSSDWRAQRTSKQVQRMKHRRRRRSCGMRYVATNMGGSPRQALVTGAATSTSPEIMRDVYFSRDEWWSFCACLDLSHFETEALFTILGGDDIGKVDLRGMLVVLRATVAPDVSLEKFATRVLARYGSLRGAFESVCSWPQRLMSKPEFEKLAETLDVNDQNARNLWDVLSSGGREHDSDPISPTGASENSKPITEDAFEKQLLVWAPGTALDALRNQICEKYGSLAQGCRAIQRALQRQAIGCNQDGPCASLRRGSSCDSPLTTSALMSVALTPAALDVGLQAVGINCCDADRVLGVAALSQVNQDGRVTLDSLIEVLRAGHGNATGIRRSGSAHSLVRDETLPLWQRLHSVQAELASGLNEDPDDPGRALNDDALCLRTPPLLRGRTPPRTSSPVFRERAASCEARPTSCGGGLIKRSRANPFTPLYQAVASAVRSVSRRPARSATPAPTERTASVDTQPRQCSASPEPMASDQDIKPTGRSSHMPAAKSRARFRGKENAMPSRSPPKAAQFAALQNTRNHALQPRAVLQERLG